MSSPDEIQHLRELVSVQRATLEKNKIQLNTIAENFESLLQTLKDNYPDSIVSIRADSLICKLRQFVNEV